MATDCLDWAVADFSGSGAAEKRDDGPCCMLSAVEKRRDQRLRYDVLEHDPTHEDIRALRRRLPTALTRRALTLVGLTTAGSARSPTPRVEGCGALPHHLWTFPRVAEGTQAL